MTHRIHALRVEHLAQAPADFLQGDPEGGAYHRAFQAAELPDFQFGYYAVWRGEERVAVVPYFVMDFRLTTMLGEEGLARWLGWVRFKIACVGHPSTDIGRIDGEVSQEVLAAVNAELSGKAALIAYKGFDGDLPLPGFVRARGLPVAVLDLAADYWKSIGTDRRNNFKQKLRQGRSLTVIERDGCDDALAQSLFALYLQTYQRAAIKFELLTPKYFTATADISRYLLFYEQDRLIGFVQLICTPPRMVFRYIGMDYERNRRYGLYFLLFLKGIEVCLREGLTEMECGPTSYDFKRRLGCRMQETFVYYRHRNPFLHWLLGRARGLLEPSEEELA
jgi:hypothetical protein